MRGERVRNDAMGTAPHADASRRRSALRVLVVGNGPSGIGKDGSYHVDRTCGELLIDLTALGHEVSFVQPVEPLESARNNYGCVLTPDKVRAIGLDKGNPISAVRTLAAMLRALVRADVVYLFFPGSLPRLIAPLCRLLRIPYGVYLRGSLVEEERDAAIISQAKFVLTVSPALLPAAEERTRRATTIRAMCNISAADIVRRDFKAFNRPVQLLFVGQVNAIKGIPDLIEAVALLDRKGVRYRLTVVGLGDLHRELAERFPDGPDAAIRMVGMVEDRETLMRAYEEADIFVLPTHYEGFPRVHYEAMIKSAVVVTTMVSGIPAFMNDGENCLAVPIDDPQAIANAIVRLIKNPPLMQRLAEAGISTTLRMLERPLHVRALHEALVRHRRVESNNG